MKPIPFNTEMVRAILDGRKTVTRRCAKFVRREEFPNVNLYCSACEVDKLGSTAYCIYQKINGCWNEMTLPLKPKYEVGDILYVRETWAENKKTGKCYYRANSECSGKSTDYGCPEAYDRSDNCDLCDWMDGFIKWKPSIHMPKEAARIFLRVTDVRVERLQDMTVSDVLKEGLMCECPFTCEAGTEKDCWTMWNKWEYLWNSTLKKDELDQYGWDANPYVWVYEFEVISKDEAYDQ